MSEQHEAGSEQLPPPVRTLPPRPDGQQWYRTLDEAIHVWAIQNDLHGDQVVPEIRVYLHSHIGGWNVS
jgi:hypothetical protein